MNTALPFVSPEPPDTFVNVCSVNGRSGLAGYAEAGCAIVGNTNIPLQEIPAGTFTL